MIFKTDYYAPMDRGYGGNNPKDINPSADIERPIVPMSEIGQSVTEGQRFGSFLQSARAAIRTGTGKIELAPQMGGGGEPVGSESYGHDAREALRETARVNDIKFTSIHTPAQIGNMSGFNAQQGGFSDEFRDKELEEVKSAVRFAAEVAEGAAVVIHTGEYQRPMFDATWNRGGKWDGAFKQYAEEPERAVKPLVDNRTGKVIQEVRMNQIVPRAVWNRYEEGNDFFKENGGLSYTDEQGNSVGVGDYIDYEGNHIERVKRVPKYDKEKNEFVIHQEKWDDLEKEAKIINKERAQEHGMSYQDFINSRMDAVLTPEEAFLHATTETQEAIANGWAGNYNERTRGLFKDLIKFKKAKEFYVELEANVPEDERWKLRQQFEQRNPLIPSETKMPVEFIDEQLRTIRESIDSTKDMLQGQLQQALDQKILREHSTTARKYALKQTSKSYAEAGIEAMQQSDNNPYAKRPIFLAPENIFPEMGYGSHPDELIELVQDARKKMVEFLTKKKIETPGGRLYTDEEANAIGRPELEGSHHMMNNPHLTDMTREQAEKEAEEHIKATFDTQHLGMWFNNFQAKEGETLQSRKKRFNGWYMDQVEKLSKSGVVGHIHLVDAIGGSHMHLPAGQGDLPLKETISLLKKNGYKGAINSEGWDEDSRFGAGRVLTETWKEFGSPIYNISAYRMQGPSLPGAWGSVHKAYAGQNVPPYFIFGAYSPSNEWKLWSDVPME